MFLYFCFYFGNQFYFQEIDHLYYFQKVKIRERNMYMSLFLRSGNNEINNSGISLHIWFYFHEFYQILYQLLSFTRSTRNLTDFLYFFIHIFFPSSTMWKDWINIFLYIDISLYFCFYFANPFDFHVIIHVTSKK